MSGALLELRSFGVGFREQVVLADISFAIAGTGMTALVGPGGSGKSTLLRTLAGINDAHPALSTWGEVLFDGGPLRFGDAARAGEQRRGIGLVIQHARFFLASVRENLVSALPNRALLERSAQNVLIREHLQRNGLPELLDRLDDDVGSLPTATQRRLAIARACVGGPLLLLADEPTAGLEEDDALRVVEQLRHHAKERAVLFVTHNQRHARAAGGTTILLAGGRVLETSPTEAFFSAPTTDAGAAFVRSGRCPETSPGADIATLDADAPLPAPAPDPRTASRYEGPRGFFWVWPGKLGGLPRPGIVDSVNHDLAALGRLGIKVLVTLEENPTVDPRATAEHGLSALHFPIVDMSVPSLQAAEQLCDTLRKRIAKGEAVAVHCRAGLGRTGTMLAAMLIADGHSAHQAIEWVRAINVRCIQSDAQVAFLSSFEKFMHGRGNLPTAPVVV